jgi:hypothetical protein
VCVCVCAPVRVYVCLSLKVSKQRLPLCRMSARSKKTSETPSTESSPFASKKNSGSLEQHYTNTSWMRGIENQRRPPRFPSPLQTGSACFHILCSMLAVRNKEEGRLCMYDACVKVARRPAISHNRTLPRHRHFNIKNSASGRVPFKREKRALNPVTTTNALMYSLTGIHIHLRTLHL